jgi:hypothetical protein
LAQIFFGPVASMQDAGSSELSTADCLLATIN